MNLKVFERLAHYGGGFAVKDLDAKLDVPIGCLVNEYRSAEEGIATFRSKEDAEIFKMAKEAIAAENAGDPWQTVGSAASPDFTKEK